MTEARFADRVAAGRYLAGKLERYVGRTDAIVLALPRGGVPVGFEVAAHLRLPFDLLIVRKLGVPGYEELAMGAVASGGARVLNEDVLAALPWAAALLDEVAAREHAEIERRECAYGSSRDAPELKGRTVILVDDGLATGATMRAAIKALRGREVERIVVAVPVGSPETCREIEEEVDEMICAFAPEQFQAVGQAYEDFAPTTDAEIRALLAAATSGNGGKSSESSG